jgi:uncharacterized membrane protein YesL
MCAVATLLSYLPLKRYVRYYKRNFIETNIVGLCPRRIRYGTLYERANALYLSKVLRTRY